MGLCQMRWWRAAEALAALCLCAGAAAAQDAPAGARQDELLHLLRQDCGSCHGLTLRGGLGPPLTPAMLLPRSDEVLVATILHGRAGTPMPPWRFAIAPAEAEWLVMRLRAGDAAHVQP